MIKLEFFTIFLVVRTETGRSTESQVIFDSSYFKNIDAVEAAIEKNSKLQEIDSRVKEEHLESLKKFYTVSEKFFTLINFK